MTFRCPNEQYYFERIPLSQNIEYRVLDCLQLNYSAGSQTTVGMWIYGQLCMDKSCKMLWDHQIQHWIIYIRACYFFNLFIFICKEKTWNHFNNVKLDIGSWHEGFKLRIYEWGYPIATLNCCIIVVYHLKVHVAITIWESICTRNVVVSRHEGTIMTRARLEPTLTSRRVDLSNR